MEKRTSVVLKVDSIEKHYGKFQVLKNISFDVKEGEVFSIFGESGIGKSTLAKIVAGLEKPNRGNVFFWDRNLREWLKISPKNFRRRVQIVFQDSTSIFNPRMNVEDVLLEPFIIQGIKDRDSMLDYLNKYGLDETILNLSPYRLSGGQRQRIAIVRSLILEPEFLILDEVFKGLDFQVKAQLINFLIELRDSCKITILLISHEKKIIEYLSDRVYYLKYNCIEEA